MATMIWPLELSRPRRRARRATGRAGSDSGSPWTRKKSAGPPSAIVPASGSPSSSPPRQVAAPSASHGSSPAATSASTSQASWFARSEPPPKSVPRRDPDAGPVRARRTLSIARSRRSSDRRARRRWRTARSSSSRRTTPTTGTPPASTRGTCPAGPSRAADAVVQLEAVLDRVDAAGDALDGARRAGPQCAVTRAPRAWAASTARAISSAVHGHDRRIGAVEVELDEVRAVVELADRRRRRARRRSRLDRSTPAAARRPRRSRIPAARMCGSADAAARAIADAEAERPPPAVDRIDEVPARRRREPSARRRRSAAAALRSATSSSASAPSGDAVDPVRAARQGQVAVAVDHARDDRRAARVDDLESVRRAGVLLGVGRSDPADRSPSSTRMLTPTWSRSERPSARAASR